MNLQGELDGEAKGPSSPLGKSWAIEGVVPTSNPPPFASHVTSGTHLASLGFNILICEICLCTRWSDLGPSPMWIWERENDSQTRLVPTAHFTGSAQ